MRKVSKEPRSLARTNFKVLKELFNHIFIFPFQPATVIRTLCPSHDGHWNGRLVFAFLAEPAGEERFMFMTSHGAGSVASFVFFPKFYQAINRAATKALKTKNDSDVSRCLLG